MADTTSPSHNNAMENKQEETKQETKPPKPYSYNAKEYDWCVRKFRAFFARKGMIEVPTQSTVDILSACEDTQNLGTFVYVDKQKYPLKQTGQMVLEHELLAHPEGNGYFCSTVSYRFEKSPKPGRHEFVFPMMEFEIHGDLNALISFERELLEFFGFGKADSFPQDTYLNICKKYNTTELTHEHEEQLRKDYGPVFFLTDFPSFTSPFWNMKRNGDNTLAKKCDVIMNGIETIGSAERSCDTKTMRQEFGTIMNGAYAKALFDEFGKERVEKELDVFFSHTFIERSGAGIGVNRMIAALKAAKLMPSF